MRKVAIVVAAIIVGGPVGAFLAGVVLALLGEPIPNAPFQLVFVIGAPIVFYRVLAARWLP